MSKFLWKCQTPGCLGGGISPTLQADPGKFPNCPFCGKRGYTFLREITLLELIASTAEHKADAAQNN